MAKFLNQAYFLKMKKRKKRTKISADARQKSRKRQKKMENELAKMMKKGHKMSIFHEKDGYLHGTFPDV